MKINLQGLSYKLLLLSCIIVSLFSNYELTFLIWLTAFLITIKNNYSLTIFKYVFIFTLILLIAIVSSFFNKLTKSMFLVFNLLFN